MFRKRNTRITVGPSQEPEIVVGPCRPVVVAPSPQTSVIIGPRTRGAWDQLGWTRSKQGNRNVYEGFYQVENRRTRQKYRFRGRVIVTGRDFVIYVADPPAKIKDHPKGPCFALENPPWFRLHWHRPPKNVDDAILYMEKILYEVLN